MPASLPLIPGGRKTSAPFSSCWPSGREICTASGLKAPAFRLAGPAPKLGPNGRSAIVLAQPPPPGAELRVKASAGCTGPVPDHGVIVIVVWFGPQVGGVLSTARGPPLKVRSKEVNGTCGASLIVVDSCPVIGSARTFPSSRTEIP